MQNLDPKIISSFEHANLASYYSKIGDHLQAIQELEKSIELNPHEPLLWSNLAIQYKNVKNYEFAYNCFYQALKFGDDSTLAVVWNNIGSLHFENRNFSQAAICYKKAIQHDSEYVTAHVNLGIAFNILKHWDIGFAELEWRFEHYPEMAYYLKNYDQTKRWNGLDSLEGKKLLIHGEQGFGDMIMFSRFIKNFKDLGAKTIVDIPEILNDVFKDIEGVDIIVNQVLPSEYDYQISLMSAPHLLGTKKINGNPYIPHLKSEIDSTNFNIGIVWSGNPNQADDHERSIPFEIFSELLTVPNVSFHSFQLNHKEMPLVGEINNFNDTRRFLSGMDLVIGCQTAVIHLAGAMGIPVWNLLSYDPDWRWGAKDSWTEWYKSMKIFRQPTHGDWSSVIQEIKQKLIDRSIF